VEKLPPVKWLVEDAIKVQEDGIWKPRREYLEISLEHGVCVIGEDNMQLMQVLYTEDDPCLLTDENCACLKVPFPRIRNLTFDAKKVVFNWCEEPGYETLSYTSFFTTEVSACLLLLSSPHSPCRARSSPPPS
jgi:hypothetical protein